MIKVEIRNEQTRKSASQPLLLKSHGASMLEVVLLISLVAVIAIPAILSTGIYSGDNLCAAAHAVRVADDAHAEQNGLTLLRNPDGTYDCKVKSDCVDSRPGEYCGSQNSPGSSSPF